MRIKLFEFEDLRWFPEMIRQGMTDYLRYLLSTLKMYDVVVPLIEEALDQAKVNRIVDVCSGGGGPVETICKNLSRKRGNLEILLTDIYPNIDSFKLIKFRSGGKINFSPAPVDASDIPREFTGVRTMFSAFHHFEPEKVKSVLKDAVDKKAPVAIFDGGDKNIVAILGILLFHPVAFLLFTPFFKPFRISRIFFTYLIPLIPICTVWDGLVSILRLYSPDQMRELALEVESKRYRWKAGVVNNELGFKITYLVGWPI